MSRHNYGDARSYARNALNLAPDKIAPEVILMHFVVASASIALKDLSSAEAAYRGYVFSVLRPGRPGKYQRNWRATGSHV